MAAAFFFQISPILTVRRPYPAVWLSEEQLDRHAHKLASTPTYLIRQIVVLLKLVGGLFWGQSNEVRTFLTLPSYPADPGSRRTEKRVVPLLPAHREPVPLLVQIGRREEERGRDGERDHKHAVDVESV
ncbi:MAG: hypothetical protein IPK82_22935 [Polyangiaceae bacterium]|nr:hypothetical protein [Polyangiaceae bacterium]